MLTFLFAGPPAVIDFTKPAIQQGLTQAGDPNMLFGQFISNILRAVLVIGVLSVAIFLIWGSIEWISGGGDKAKIEAARNKMTGSVIGLVVLAAVIAIMILIQSALKIQVFNFV
jgi:hypothetical protein